MDIYRGIAVGEHAHDADRDLLVGEERMAQNVFFRTMNCWKIGDVSATKFKPLPPKPQLPVNSIVHLMDNFYKIENGLPISDIPSLDCPFILNENFRKYIHHILAPVTDGVIKSPNDYVYRTLQLQRNLEKFRSTHSGKYLFVRNLEPLKDRGPFLGIINHNPIFRLFCRGIMPYWRALVHCITSVFNVAVSMPEKLHYIFIPLSEKIYTKSKFQQAAARITNGSLVYKTSYQYMFFVQLYNFVNTLCTIPTVFDQIPKDFYPKINLVFYIGDQYLIWTLYDLITLNERNQIFTRLFNHFNGFVLTATAKEMAKPVKVIDDREDTQELSNTGDGELKDNEIERSIVNNFSQITNTKVSDLIDPVVEEPQLSVDEISKEDERNLDKLLVSIQGIHFAMGDKSTTLDVSDVSELIEEEVPEPEVSIEYPEAIAAAAPDPSMVPPQAEVKVPEFTGEFYKDDQLDTVKLPIDTHEPYRTSEQMVEMGKKFVEYIDDRATIAIKKNPRLTIGQKERAVKMAESYKSVQLNGKSLQQWMTEKVDPTLQETGTIEALKGSIPDEGMIHSSIIDLDRVYLEKMFHRHMASVAASMTEHGLYLQAIEERVTNTELTQTKDYSFKYKDVHGKQHSVNFTMPVIREDGVFLVNGIRSVMTKQLYNKPIAKISPTRVSLASNYNKTIVEKKSATAHDFGNYFDQLIAQIQEDKPNALKVSYGIRNVTEDATYGYEYAKLIRKYHSLEIKHQKQNATSFLYFGDPSERKNEPAFKSITPLQWKEIEDYENKEKVIFIGMKTGSAPYTPARYYMDRGSRLLMIGIENGAAFNVPLSILDMLQGATDVYAKKPLTEWVDIRILDGRFPVGFLLCYRFGLLTMLRRLNVKYKIVNTRSLKNENLRSTDIIIRFADNKALVIPRYPLKVSLIFQGLTMFDTKIAPIEEYENSDVYYRLLMDKKQGNGRTNYLIGIDDTFDMFIDVMTYDRLVQMHEPTTFEGLLIRATEMLVVPYHKEASAMANHCLRTYERMNAILYNEMTSQYRSYRKQRGNTAFSINPNAVLQRIIQDPTVMQVEDINPIHDIKTTTKVTYLGMGGRTAESFTVQDRRYPQDGIGVLSEATPDSGNVAITAQTSLDPIIGNVYGLIEPNKKPSDLDPTQILSVSSLLMPCVTQDDSKRTNFVNIQLSHTMPTKEGECGRLRTGFEKMIAHRCSDIYAYTAKQAGVVLDVDETLKLVKIKYADGKIHAFSYDTQYGECSDMYTEQRQILTIKKGDRFKQHEVLRYNPQFFEPDQDDLRQVNYKHGRFVNVAIVDNSVTFEDSNAISERLSKELEIAPIDPKMLTIQNTAVVHDIKTIGDKVEINDPLITFELSDTADLTGVTTNEMALAYLEKLNRTAPKAKTKGTIVDVKIFYSQELGEMHPSMAAAITKINKRKQQIARYVKDTESVYNFAGSSKVPDNSKFKGVTVDKNTVIFQYLIQQDLDHHAGDKMVIDSSLKTVTCVVMQEPPTTESGETIDVLFSATSISNRIVNSPILVGISEKVLETLEERIVDLYFDD